MKVLPVRTAGAAENMAVDFLLLQRWPAAAAGDAEPRFRHYEWRTQAFTFGYSQQLEFIKAQLPPTEDVRWDLCRRPTGGGLVDHREDWTYTVVVPRGHPWEEARATESYRMIHACLADALNLQGVLATLAQPGGPKESVVPGICFVRAEVHDVVARSGAKIAGAAQKRNKQGLLFQGSIWKPAAGANVDWDKFEEDFQNGLAGAMASTANQSPWPEFNEGEVEALVEQYSGEEWNGFR